MFSTFCQRVHSSGALWPSYASQMHSRRRFLTLAAGTALGVAVAGAPRGWADPAPTLAAGLAGRAPTAWGTTMPGIVSSFKPDGKQIALTFDLCPGGYDDALVKTLVANKIPAVLFLNSRWIDKHFGQAAELAANPLFEIGNHGTRHVPLSVTGRSAYGIAGTRSAAEVVDEVWTNHQKITALTGKAPTWFRTGTAHYDDVAVAIVKQLGETPLGFTVNGDGGATLKPPAVAANLTAAAPGSIVISHMNHPEAGTGAGYALAIPKMLAAGWQFVAVSAVAGR